MKPRRTTILAATATGPATTPDPCQARYTVVCGENADDLTRKVESMLAQGWRVTGGVCFSTWRFYQAMTR